MSSQRVPGGVVHELPEDLRKALVARSPTSASFTPFMFRSVERPRTDRARRRRRGATILRVKHYKEASALWKKYVPSTGQADTVQGELIRGVEKLRDEAQRNGNINWDDGHEILATFIRDTLVVSGVFDESACAEIHVDVTRLLDYERPETSDEPFDRLTDRIVEWARAHPEPLPHPLNPKLHR